MNDVYAFIEAEKTTHHVALLCRLPKVARSSFYGWLASEKTRRAKQAADDVLAHEITVLHLASRGSYGVPRIHAGLRRLAHRVNRKRIDPPPLLSPPMSTPWRTPHATSSSTPPGSARPSAGTGCASRSRDWPN